jgi:hypothetical protein
MLHFNAYPLPLGLILNQTGKQLFLARFYYACTALQYIGYLVFFSLWVPF